MKTVLIVVGVVALVLMVVFLWLHVARADQSRGYGKNNNTKETKEGENKNDAL